MRVVGRRAGSGPACRSLASHDVRLASSARRAVTRPAGGAARPVSFPHFRRRRLPPMRSLRTLALLTATVASLAACDVYTEDPDDDLRVRVVDFEFDRDDYSVSTDGTIASFESDDIASGSQRDALQAALRTAGDGAVVVAYIRTDFLISTSTADGQTYSALPVARAFRGEIPYDVDNDGVEDEFVPVETVLSYEYSFDNEDFYFDVVSSDPDSDFDAGALFGFAIADDPNLRVVTIPADVFNKTSVDLTDYAAVRAAFRLPD